MSKHNDKKVWMLRKDGDSNGFVWTKNDKEIHLYYYSNINDPTSIIDFDMNRIDARLLAKRILECLDDTK